MSQWDGGPSKFYVAIWGLRIITKLVSKKCAKHAIKNELKSSNHAENYNNKALKTAESQRKWHFPYEI